MYQDFIFLDLENLEEERELLEGIKENIQKARKLRKEVERLKNSSTKPSEEANFLEEKDLFTEIPLEIEEESDKTSLEEEAFYYFMEIYRSDFQKIDLEEKKRKIREILPSKKHPQYFPLIQRIKANFLKEIKDIKSFLAEEENLVKEEWEELKEDALLAQTKMDLITEVSEEVEEEYSEDKEENKLLFLPTTGGSIYALEDIDGIAQEYYEGFIELLDSIKDGTFKNVKMLTGSNNKTAGIAEVKNFKRRIIFDRIGRKEYIILAMFIKKSDKDKGYVDPLKHRISIYRTYKEKGLANVQEESFLEENKKIENALYDMLKKGNKTMAKIYGKEQVENGVL